VGSKYVALTGQIRVRSGMLHDGEIMTNLKAGPIRPSRRAFNKKRNNTDSICPLEKSALNFQLRNCHKLSNDLLYLFAVTYDYTCNQRKCVATV